MRGPSKSCASSRLQDLVIFVPTLGGGGAERVALTLANGFARCGLRVLVVHAGGSSAYAIPSGVSALDLGARRVRSTAIALRGVIARVRPTAVLSVMTHANILAKVVVQSLPAGLRPRLVLSEHASICHRATRAVNRVDRHLVGLLRTSYSRHDNIVAVSAGLARELERCVPALTGRVNVIFNPIDVAGVRSASALPFVDWTEGRAEPRIVAAGRLIPDKGFDVLLHAVAHLPFPAHVTIFGTGPEAGVLGRLATELGIADHVALPGFSRNPYPQYARAAVLALPSRSEALPTFLLEALALEVPIVASDCEHGPAEILRGGRDGVLVTPGSFRELASGLTAQLDVRSAFAPEPTAVQRFSMETCIARYACLLGFGA